MKWVMRQAKTNQANGQTQSRQNLAVAQQHQFLSYLEPEPDQAMYSQKRKRSSSVLSSTSHASSHHLPSDAINPLSYSAGAIKQLQVAGLTENDLLPVTYIPNFPHRPIRTSHPPRPEEEREEEDDDDDDEEEEGHHDSPLAGSDQDRDGRSGAGAGAAATEERGSGSSTKAKRDKARRAQRMRDAQDTHLGVLVNVILRSLEEGDVPRAKRAFGLLRRSEIRGKPVDLRRNGLWSLGAEVLMRDGEERKVRGMAAASLYVGGDGNDDDDAAAAAVEREGQDGGAVQRAGEEGKERRPSREVQRWGSAANMPQLRAYLEGLIRQYPYNRLHPSSISDLDFHPVLFGCELYNAWVEHKLALGRLERDSEAWSDDMEMPEDPYSDDYDNDDEFRLSGRERRLRQERASLGLQAMRTMRDVATRMDLLLENAPYNRSVEMLRLRGMVALYVGDLSVPPPPRKDEEEEEGRRVRTEEKERARVFFAKMKEHGGRVDAYIGRWLDGGDDDEYGADEDDDMESAWSGLPVFSSLPMR